MSRMTLGREKYKVLRQKESGYVHGIWTEGPREEIEVRASVHRGIYWNSETFSSAGSMSKQAISIRSDDPIYMGSPAGIDSSAPKKPDIFIYDGTYWQVMEAGRYGNLRATKHWEAVAVRLDEKELPRSSE